MKLHGQDVSLEGGCIFGIVLYETVALVVNFIAGRRIILPITEIIGKLWRHRWGRFLVWAWFGFWIDHFGRAMEQPIPSMWAPTSIHEVDDISQVVGTD